MSKTDNTLFSNRIVEINQSDASYTLAKVYQALKEKGYNPKLQLVGYILSGDPTYITSHNGARKEISKLERDLILEELVESYINNELEKS